MPLLYLSVFFICGVILASWQPVTTTPCLFLAGLFLILAVLPPLLRRFLPPGTRIHNFPTRISHLLSRLSFLTANFLTSNLPPSLLLAVLCLGAARFTSTRFVLSPEQAAWYNDRDGSLAIDGRVAGPPELRDTYVLLEVEAERVWEQVATGSGKAAAAQPPGPSQAVEGRLLAKVPPGEWRYGDRLRLTGRLSTPFETEDFSYLDYLAHRGIHSTFACPYPITESCVQVLETGGGNPLYRWIYTLRERLTATIFKLFPDPEASLLAGILLGVEGSIPAGVRQAFNDTGTSHIIAISGFNFAIIAGLFSKVFSRLLGRWRGMLAAFLGIALYTIIAGASAGVVRAAIMGGLSVFAAQIGRRSNGLNSLLFVGALMALHDPHVLWDVGFQLSFMATLGLILYADPLEARFTAAAAHRLPQALVERLAGPVGEYFLFTLAAQLTTLPLILFYFQRLSLASLVANPLILPAQPPVMILGGLAALLGLASLPLGRLAGNLAWPFVAYTIRVVEGLARLPGGAWSIGRFHPGWLILFYALLFGWTALGEKISTWIEARWGAAGGGLVLRWAWIALVGLLLANTLVWRSALSAPDGRLHLTVLDVGSGDGFLIQTPSGRSLLIDGGPSPSALGDALGRRLPLENRGIDYWVIASAGDEQLTALEPAVERFPPGQVLWSGPPSASYSARRLRGALTEAGVPVLEAHTGQTLDLGGGARLEFLAVTKKGAVLLLEWGSFQALLPVGLDFDTLDALIKDGRQPPVTALLLTGSGYAPLNPPEWIERWRPQLTLLSVSAGDPLGRPDPETLAALEGYTVLRTDWNGWIELCTDGEKLWVEVERK